MKNSFSDSKMQASDTGNKEQELLDAEAKYEGFMPPDEAFKNGVSEENKEEEDYDHDFEIKDLDSGQKMQIYDVNTGEG